jgi:uncharacterized protein DUF5681
MIQHSKSRGRDKKRGRIENLRPPWPKGVSGNPGGRPKKVISDAYEKLADQLVPGDKQGRTFAQRLAEAQFRAAMKGRTDAAREITDRLEGKTVQRISGPDGGAIPHTIEGIDEYIMELVRSVQDQAGASH